MSKDTIYRQEAVNALDFDAELLRRALDDADVVGAERAKYEWGLWVIESCISDVKELPSTQPESRREWYMKGYRDAQDAALHESCTDCPLYDHDKHRCPRFSKVIPTTIQEILDTQPEPSIPLSWFDEQIERLKSLDNAFATLTAMQISGMVKKWRDEQDE